MQLEVPLGLRISSRMELLERHESALFPDFLFGFDPYYRQVVVGGAFDVSCPPGRIGPNPVMLSKPSSSNVQVTPM